MHSTLIFHRDQLASRTLKYIKDHKIMFRKKNEDDKRCACTDYQRFADYVVSVPGRKQECYWNGSFFDLVWIYKHILSV